MSPNSCWVRGSIRDGTYTSLAIIVYEMLAGRCPLRATQQFDHDKRITTPADQLGHAVGQRRARAGGDDWSGARTGCANPHGRAFAASPPPAAVSKRYSDLSAEDLPVSSATFSRDVKTMGCRVSRTRGDSPVLTATRRDAKLRDPTVPLRAHAPMPSRYPRRLIKSQQ